MIIYLIHILSVFVPFSTCISVIDMETTKDIRSIDKLLQTIINYNQKLKMDADLETGAIKNLLESLKQSYPENFKNGILDNFKPNKKKVAIIIPFRDRYYQLGVFLKHMHPFLIAQNLNYRIFVINQTDKLEFNRATLFNVGFIESQKFTNYHCFINTDVDLLPENSLNYYDCSHSPEHFSVYIDSFDYKALYDTHFGGVVGISKDHYLRINGYSNMYWGWGGEDDDFYKRVVDNDLKVYRKPYPISRYTTIRQHHHRVNSHWNPKRFDLLKNFNKYKMESGLTDIIYKVVGVHIRPLYTVIQVDLTDMYEEYRDYYEN